MRHQTPQGELLNNFVSGSVGGFVGTLLNTPYVVGHSPLRVAALNSIASFDVGCLFFFLSNPTLAHLHFPGRQVSHPGR